MALNCEDVDRSATPVFCRRGVSLDHALVEGYVCGAKESKVCRDGWDVISVHFDDVLEEGGQDVLAEEGIMGKSTDHDTGIEAEHAFTLVCELNFSSASLPAKVVADDLFSYCAGDDLVTETDSDKFDAGSI